MLRATQVIITHAGADFDALASAVAAQKLYPGATIVLASALSRDVRAFVALHKERFPTAQAKDIDPRAVQRAIIVDVRRAARLSHVPGLRDRILARDPALDVHVWDHHAAADDDVPAVVEHCEPVGSATTLLVEELQRQDLPVDVIDATLFALGIHVDTGSFRYSGTTARDAAALSWLLDQGARLSVINRYASLPFTAAQLRALSAALAALRIERIGGARIGVAILAEGIATEGLGEVVSELVALEDVHALIACFPMRGGKVQVVARSRVPWLDVGALLLRAGGGGHPAAAAAVLGDDAGATAERLLALLRAEPPRARRVRDVMSSPVHTITPELPMVQLAINLRRWQHTGAPVIADNRLVGIVSRRDLGRALNARRGAENVAHYMSQPVRTTEEDVLLDDALASMASADIGRLPVLRAGRLVGIVTRHDILTALYDLEP